MNIHSITPRLSLLRLLALSLLGAAFAQAQTYSRLSSRFLARGEQAILEVRVPGAQPDASPAIPQVKDVTIQSAGFGAQPRFAENKLEYTFRYVISSYEVGRHSIPSLEVLVKGVKTKTEPLEFQVFDPNDLQWAEETVGGRRLTYAARFCTMTDNPYEGETVPVEIKVYVPRQLEVEDWGIPEFERDGVASWRFEPTDRGAVNLLASPYVSVSYPSTLSATRTGKVNIGPATVRLITRQVVMDGFPRQVAEEVFLKIPKLELEARALPSGAPEGFENAVGDFSIQASTTDKEVREGEPIAVDVMVNGKGNFDTLHSPKLIDANGWKMYDAPANQRGDERRQLEGSVNYRQFLRPLEMKTSIPPFRLVFFDPKQEVYKTVVSQPLPLKILPSASSKVGGAVTPPPALPVPVESMTDILANVPTPHLLAPMAKKLPPWTWHAVGGLVSAVLLGKILWLRVTPRLRKNPEAKSKLAALSSLARAKDDTEFLKSAGSFIERHAGNTSDPALKEILAERDAKCFRGDKAAAALDRSRRDEILRVLRKSAVTLLLMTAFCLPQARAAEPGAAAQAAYDQAKYEEAIELWLSAGKFEDLSADTLYNIGNACYRVGSPGQAALYYRRALLREPNHMEAVQNLRFIERKYGSVTVAVTDYQRIVAKIPQSFWQAVFWIGAWGLLISLLIFPASLPGARVRLLGVFGLLTAPLLLIVGGLGWRHFPDVARFAPLESQAVVIAEKASIYTDAARTSPAVSNAPQGSLCSIIRKTGEWAYVSFASKTRGWIPIENLEKLIPDKQQAVPKVRKPKADASNA